MFKKINYWLASLALVSLVVGCASPTVVGGKASDTAPQLVKTLPDGAREPVVTWNNPLLFGPVPELLKVAGDIACMRARVDLNAIGYHPKAKDLQGNELSGGGYFCYPKAQGFEPDVTPPRLRQMDGVLGWDRPSAFGKVPSEVQARGDAVCERFDKNTKAIAYHPKAQLENGQTIAGGGFLCAPPLNFQ